MADEIFSKCSMPVQTAKKWTKTTETIFELDLPKKYLY
jgi:hypothetical protein